MFNFTTLMIIIFGAINWFCIGVFQFDLIAGIFGTQSHFFSRFVYTVIGLAGFWMLAVTLIKHGQLSLLPPKKKKDKKKNKKIEQETASETTEITELSDESTDTNSDAMSQPNSTPPQTGFIVQPINATTQPNNVPLNAQIIQATPMQTQPFQQIQPITATSATPNVTTQANIPQNNIENATQNSELDNVPTITLKPTNQDSEQKAKVNIEVSLPSAEKTSEETKTKKKRKTKTSTE